MAYYSTNEDNLSESDENGVKVIRSSKYVMVYATVDFHLIHV